MECIREYVDVSLHRLASLPKLSILAQSGKVLNGTAISNDENITESSSVSSEYLIFIGSCELILDVFRSPTDKWINEWLV